MYELMVVSTIGNADALFGKVEKFLKEAEAQNVKSEKLGKKTLAYPIAKQQEAEFFVFNFEAPGAAILEIGNKIKLEQEAVLRYLLVKTKPVKETKGQRGKAVKSREEKSKAEVMPRVTVETRVTTGTKEQKGKSTKVAKVKSTKVQKEGKK